MDYLLHYKVPISHALNINNEFFYQKQENIYPSNQLNLTIYDIVLKRNRKG